MRYIGRSRAHAAVASVTAALLAGVLVGCDATGDAAPAPGGTAAGASPSPKPTPVWNTSPGSVAAVGDSITRGFDACTVLSDCPEASWATGSDDAVHSLAVRLLGKSAAATHSWNYAQTGARMADLPEQMEQAAEKSPELVTVLMGANDACRGTLRSMTPVAEFKRDFEDALGRLRSEVPKAQVYVASVPDLKRLWSTGRADNLAKQVWKLGICPTMLSAPDAIDTKAAERREKVLDRVVAYNDALEEVCRKDRRCRFDGGAVHDFRFGTAQLSHWDWFHPSKDGQSRLAELAFERVTAEQSVSGGS